MRRTALLTFIVALLFAGALAPAQAQPDGSSHRDLERTHRPRLLPLHVDPSSRTIVDARDRQVTLRGVNVSSLAEYYQGNPDLPTVVPVTDADWDSMAAHGFNVVRLLVSWSRLEPARGVIDWEYLTAIEHAVDAAAARGIYSVIDMHQDAWGPHIATPPGLGCPPGRTPAIGWDGAPKWATLIDGADTCRAGGREDTPAVRAAWDGFYADRDAIQSHLVVVWYAIARHFADHPAVAGYDLLNEPNHGSRTDFADRLGDFYGRAITAIRAGEQQARADGRRVHAHIAIFEPTVFGTPVAPGFSTDPNLVFGPHNYGESISPLPVEVTFDYFDSLARWYGVPLWIGEYGWFGDPVADQAPLARYAAKEDALITAGGAWWQWRQACGDPHTIGTIGGTPPATVLQMQANACPGDVNLGVIAERACTWRPYPRAVPGRLTATASPCTGPLDLSGTTDRPGWAEVWYPGRAKPTVTGTHDRVVHRRVRGGWLVYVHVDDDYAMRVAA